MAGKTAPLPCPECSGDMWDNVENKRNPKAPDYACKNKECGKGVWLKPAEKAALQAAVTPATGAAKRPPIVIDKMMKVSIQSAQKMIDEIYGETEVPLTEVFRIALSLYISRTDNKGIFELEKAALAEKAQREAVAEKVRQELAEVERKAKEEEANRTRRATPSSFDDFPSALEDRDDDLPF